MKANRLEERFEALTLYANRIKKTLPRDLAAYAKSGYEIKNVIERNLQLISDAEFDVLILLYKKVGTEPVGREEHLPNRLALALDRRVLDGYERRRGLRNRLVHEYADFTLDKEVFGQASSLEDVEEFRKATGKALAKA